MATNKFIFSIFIICMIFINGRLSADTSEISPDTIRSLAPGVYVDCSDCDHDYLKTNIKFINYVRDPQLADIHILTSSQNTAGGGEEFTLEFIGKKDFAGMVDTLKYISGESASEDDIRRGLTETIKRGLIRYISQTPLAEYVKVDCSMPSKPVEVVDKWKNWVFGIDLYLWGQGQKSFHEYSISGYLTASRVTEITRFVISLYNYYRENEYDYEDYNSLSISRTKSAEVFYNHAISDHWTWALAGGITNSSYSNLDLQVYGAPMLEYNIFPYTQSTRRQLRLAYKAYFIHNDYVEETIYDKTEEWLAKHRLQVAVDFIQPWGTAEISMTGTHYFHDFQKNRLQLYGEVSMHIVKGLSFEVNGNVSRIHDQLTLSKGEASDEDVILQRQELETSYDYYVSIGINYSFGSIYNNIVNPRFGY